MTKLYQVEIKYSDNEQPIETDGAAPLLQVMERAGLVPEFGCRQGFCGACRMILLEGEVSYLSPPLAFLRENEILPCCCRAKSDIKIALPVSISSTDRY